MKPSQKKLLRTALANIIMYPAKWNQEQWCGTSYCLAGHVVALKGYKASRGHGGVVRNAKGKTGHVAELAQDFLGLDYNEAQDLFSFENDIATLAYKVNKLAGALTGYSKNANEGDGGMA
jgi:hypothetical protein